MEARLHNESIGNEPALNVSRLINCNMMTESNCTDGDGGNENSFVDMGITFAIFIIAVVAVGLIYCKIRRYRLLARYLRSVVNEHETLHHVSSEGESYCPPPSYSSGLKMMRLDSTTIEGYPPPKYSSLITTRETPMGSNNLPQEVSGSTIYHTPDDTPVAGSSVGNTSNTEIGGNPNTYGDHVHLEFDLWDGIVIQNDHPVALNEETHECSMCPTEMAITSDEFPSAFPVHTNLAEYMNVSNSDDRHYPETRRSQHNSGYMNHKHSRRGSCHVYHITLENQPFVIYEHLPTYEEANAPLESTHL